MKKNINNIVIIAKSYMKNAMVKVDCLGNFATVDEAIATGNNHFKNLEWRVARQTTEKGRDFFFPISAVFSPRRKLRQLEQAAALK